MPTAAVALGSNLGDRHAHIQAALDALRALPATRLLRVSEIIETEPVGPVDQGHYLNAAALISTSIPPRTLLEALLAIEHTRGRDRTVEQRWGPRTLDLDLLLYDSLILHEPGLTIPHPRLQERLFVLGPLAGIAPDMVIPSLHATAAELLAALRANRSGPQAVQPPSS